MDKSAVLAALLACAQGNLDAIATSQREIQAAATHDEAKPEGDKDTRATESSYLARGLAQRVSQMQAVVTGLTALELRAFESDSPIAVSALVTLEDDASFVSHYFVAPGGGGLSVRVDDVAIAIVTPSSPLGAALIGRRVDDDIELQTPSGTRELTVISVV